MRQFKQFSLLMLIVSSLFMTGCDAGKILDIISKVAEGIQQAMPAIREVVNTVQQTFPQDNRAAADDNTQTTASPETASKKDAAVVVTSPGDDEEVSGNAQVNQPAQTNRPPQVAQAPQVPQTNQNSQNNGNSTPAAASQAEAALAYYRGQKLSPDEFASVFGPAATEVSRQSGVPASIILAQAALETGWGEASIGDARNLFGIKGTGPAGTISVPTQEYIDGRMVTVNDNFRRYNSWMESMLDHSRLLQGSRYADAMRNRNDPDQFARELQRAGYATDPDYASKLISIMRANDFYRYNV